MEWLRDRLIDALQLHLTSPDDERDIPVAGRRIWTIFCDLTQTRQIGFAPCAISYQEIEAYSRMMRTPIRPFEIEIIRALDRAFLDHVAKLRIPTKSPGHSEMMSPGVPT